MIVALVLLSAFLHAMWNAFLRLESDKDRSLVVAIVVATLLATVIALVRWGLGEPPFASFAGLGYTLGAGAFEAIYFATLARAMDRGRLGTVYTISRGGAVLVVWPLSIVLFGELATTRSIAGSIVVLLGLVLCGMAAGAAAPRATTQRERSAVAYAVACAISIAGYHLAYTAALREDVNPSACFAVSLGVSAAINLVRLRGRGDLIDLVRRRWPRLVVMGFVCGGSFLILMQALAIGGAGYVLTLRNTSVLFATGMAFAIGERPRNAEIVGAAAVAAGAVLMAW